MECDASLFCAIIRATTAIWRDRPRCGTGSISNRPFFRPSCFWNHVSTEDDKILAQIKIESRWFAVPDVPSTAEAGLSDLLDWAVGPQGHAKAGYCQNQF